MKFLKTYEHPLRSIAGLLAVLTFGVFTVISIFLFPVPYNPLYEWVSNLGNIYFNPIGSYFFNWGCIITGLILIIFFGGLYIWNPRETWRKILLLVGMLLGIISSISLIMVGIFPETYIHQHVIAATGVFGLLFIIIILLNVALFKNPKFMRLIAYFGLLVVIVDIIFIYSIMANGISNNLHPMLPIPGLEWGAVVTSLIWVGLLSLNMLLKKM
jgi:hypothetical membrane protein